MISFLAMHYERPRLINLRRFSAQEILRQPEFRIIIHKSKNFYSKPDNVTNATNSNSNRNAMCSTSPHVHMKHTESNVEFSVGTKMLLETGNRRIRGETMPLILSDTTMNFDPKNKGLGSFKNYETKYSTCSRQNTMEKSVNFIDDHKNGNLIMKNDSEMGISRTKEADQVSMRTNHKDRGHKTASKLICHKIVHKTRKADYKTYQEKSDKNRHATSKGKDTKNNNSLTDVSGKKLLGREFIEDSENMQIPQQHWAVPNKKLTLLSRDGRVSDVIKTDVTGRGSTFDVVTNTNTTQQDIIESESHPTRPSWCHAEKYNQPKQGYSADCEVFGSLQSDSRKQIQDHCDSKPSHFHVSIGLMNVTTCDGVVSEPGNNDRDLHSIVKNQSFSRTGINVFDDGRRLEGSSSNVEKGQSGEVRSSEAARSGVQLGNLSENVSAGGQCFISKDSESTKSGHDDSKGCFTVTPENPNITEPGSGTEKSSNFRRQVKRVINAIRHQTDSDMNDRTELLSRKISTDAHHKYDAKLEKSGIYLRSRSRTFTRASQYMQGPKAALRQLNVHYSQTNSCHNDKIIFSHLLRSAHIKNAVIAESVYSMERRLYNRRQDRCRSTTFYDILQSTMSSSTTRQRPTTAASSHYDQQQLRQQQGTTTATTSSTVHRPHTKRTVADKKRERQERIHQKNEMAELGYIPKATSLMQQQETLGPEDMERMLQSCRYLRVHPARQPWLYHQDGEGEGQDSYCE